MLTRPEDIVNEALDEIGVDEIGDLADGSRAARVATRVYDSMLRAMHAAAPWNFARRDVVLTLLADQSGQYVTNTNVPSPWAYAYEWPIDCVHARYVPGLGTTALDADGLAVGVPPAWTHPVPFLVTDMPYPNLLTSSWDTSEGHSPESTRCVLTNELGAHLIYTGLVQYPDAWDPLFRRAFVAGLSARFALPLIEDKKLAMVLREENRRIAKEALIEARVRDGNEGWTVVNHTPDWIRARTSLSPAGFDYYYPWLSMPLVEDGGGVY